MHSIRAKHNLIRLAVFLAYTGSAAAVLWFASQLPGVH